MENWFEFLIPIIIVLLYLFSRGRGGDEVEGPPPSESQTSEQARRIQEEIRRKIVARQQGQTGESAQAPAHPAGKTPQPEAPPEKSFLDASYPTEFERYGETPEEPEWVAPAAAAAASEARDYEGELKAQLRRVKEAREARREASGGSVESDEIGAGIGIDHQAGRVRRRYGTYSLDTVLDELHSREGLQKAFVLKEVLGQPVGVRPVRDSYAEFSRGE